MSKAVPILSILLAAAIGGGIYFYVNNEKFKQKIAELDGHAGNLANELNMLTQQKDDLEEEKSRTEEKLKHAEGEHEKTLAKLQEEQRNKEKLEKERDKVIQDVESLQNEIQDQRVKISQLNNGIIKVKMDNKILFPSGE